MKKKILIVVVSIFVIGILIMAFSDDDSSNNGLSTNSAVQSNTSNTASNSSSESSSSNSNGSSNGNSSSSAVSTSSSGSNSKGTVILNYNGTDTYVIQDQTTGKFGFMDNNKKQTVPCKYESVVNFLDAVAPVKENGLWGYIFKDGSQELQPQFLMAYPELDAMRAVLTKDNNFLWVNQHGVPFQFSSPQAEDYRGKVFNYLNQYSPQAANQFNEYWSHAYAAETGSMPNYANASSGNSSANTNINTNTSTNSSSSDASLQLWNEMLDRQQAREDDYERSIQIINDQAEREQADIESGQSVFSY